MTKKGIITYLLSEEGRKKSLLSGGDGREWLILKSAMIRLYGPPK